MAAGSGHASGGLLQCRNGGRSMPKHSASGRDLIQALIALGFEQVLTDIGIDEKKILQSAVEIRALIKNLAEWAAKLDSAAQRQNLTALGVDQTVLRQSTVEMRTALIKSLTELRATIDCAVFADGSWQRKFISAKLDERTKNATKARETPPEIKAIIRRHLQQLWKKKPKFHGNVHGTAVNIHREVMADIGKRPERGP